MFQTPILFLVFNRPDTTLQVFEAIRQAKPSRLYIAADGPRPNKTGEKEKCEQVREIISKIDWDCDLKTLYREQNLGCKIAVSSAIDWFFENEEEGIILEDDCLPDQSFFGYCEELLNKYRHNEKIMHIGGCNVLFDKTNINEDYFFSKFSLIWGWASWRRAWKLYDREAVGFIDFVNSTHFKDVFISSSSKNYWIKIYQKIKSNQINTWDYQWNFSLWQNKGLAVLPTKNLIKNIGFGIDSTHTGDNSNILANLKLEKIVLPLRHPPFVIRKIDLDNIIDKLYFNIPFQKKVLNKLIKILKF